jgi:uracil-DNA glycosylase family 4
MKGFFDKGQFQSPSYRSEKGTLSCASCGLYKNAISPKMQPYGNFKKQIMVIGEAPIHDDDKKGKPFHSEGGRLLQRKLKQLGIDLFEDCVCLNAVACRPADKEGNNRTPTDHEIACCRQKALASVKQYNPKVIILLGGVAVTSLITGYRWKGGSQNGIMTWRGWAIPDREFNTWICPTFHPAFVERQEEVNEVEVIWTQDLKKALKLQDSSIHFAWWREERKCIEITDDIEGVLKKIIRQGKKDGKAVAFDIETTGLKPYNTESHKIVTISFCNDANKACAIPMPTEPKHLRLLKRLMESPEFGKIAANMKYEDNWLNFLYGIQVYPWVFDTMQAAHILDNRPGITGLKFQSYVKLGTPRYDDEIAAYLKSPDANTPNRIMELVKDREGFRKLLLYNGIDSLVTFRLASLQMRELGLIKI